MCADFAPFHLLHFLDDEFVELVEFFEEMLLVVALLEVTLPQLLLLSLRLDLSLELSLQRLTHPLPQQPHDLFYIRLRRHSLFLQLLPNLRHKGLEILFADEHDGPTSEKGCCGPYKILQLKMSGIDV